MPEIRYKKSRSHSWHPAGAALASCEKARTLPTAKHLSRVACLADAYRRAKAYVGCQGFGQEMEWQQSRCLNSVTESDFLRESAWVIMSAGMREAVVRRRFPGITNAFCNWVSASAIVASREACVSAALLHFNHAGKISAIANTACRVADEGINQIKEHMREGGVEYLRGLPFIGPVTSYHLAKNLGLDVVKPDRHLVRIAEAAGYLSPFEMCKELAGIVGDKVAVIDIVLWRYATLVPDYLALFVQAIPGARPDASCQAAAENI